MNAVSKKIACDIVVIGSGVSGMTAAVQAANLGKKVIVIESKSHVGGNWNVTYGMMAVNSPISKKLGIEVDTKALVNQEIRLFNYQVDARLWRNLVEKSGENVSWLMEQGVEFDQDLEPYTAGDINAPVFHTWAKGSGPSKKMLSTFEAAGGQVLTSTKGKSIVKVDGQVAGIMAEDDRGNTIQIDCKAVISAGGGYAANKKMVSKVIGREDYANRGVADNDGSSINMCIESGAKSLLGHENVLADLIPRHMDKVKHWLNYIHNRPGSFPFHVNVNQDGERYVDESCSLKLYAFSPAAAYTQERTYRLYDEEKLRKLDEINGQGIFEVLKEAADKGQYGIFRADTFEELAEKLGLDADSLTETMKTYNHYCEKGQDPEFEKTTEFLQAFKPPYYGWENGYQIPATFEGVDYNIDMEVLDETSRTIPGLFVAGLDGAKLWRGYYSLSIPGSANSNNINSGRVAAKSAVNSVLCFTNPPLSMTGKIVWAYVTYIGRGMLYTLVGLPFLSLMSVSTQDIGERSSLSAFRSWGSQIGVLFATGTMMMLVGFFGGGDMGKGFQLTMILFASVAAVLYICLGLFTKERAPVPDKQKLKLKEGIKLLFTNKPWIVLNVFFVLFFLYIMTRNAFGMYYFSFYLNSQQMFGPYMILNTIPSFVVIPFMPGIIKRFGKAKSIGIGAIVIGISGVLFFAAKTNVPFVLFASVINGVGMGIIHPTMWAMLPDTVEYGEWKTGKRAPGLTVSASSFTQKVAQGVAGWLAGVILTVIAYQQGAVEQTAQTISGLYTWNAVIPIVFGIFALVVMKFYTLNEATFENIMADLKSRKEADEPAAEDGTKVKVAFSESNA